MGFRDWGFGFRATIVVDVAVVLFVGVCEPPALQGLAFGIQVRWCNVQARDLGFGVWNSGLRV